MTPRLAMGAAETVEDPIGRILPTAEALGGGVERRSGRARWAANRELCRDTRGHGSL